MTRTWPSIAAGAEPRAAALASWLRRAAVAGDPAWIVRGSLVTAARCPGARPPADVDYVAPGAGADFDDAALAARLYTIAAAADPRAVDPIALAIDRVEVIWAESEAPGLRAHAIAQVGGAEVRFGVDVAVGDPMCVAPRPIEVADVGAVLACAPETLFGWKLHGLCEFGRGRWRAKDLFDLDLLWRHAGLDRALTRAAIALAFASRGLPLTALDDFRARPGWGQSTSGRRKWRGLARQHPAVDDFAATRDRVRAAVAEVLEGSTSAAGGR